MKLRDFKIEKKDSFNLVGKIKVKVLVVAAVAVAGLFAAQLVFANMLATDGEKLSAIEGEVERLEAENTTLRVKIAQESSLSTISTKAQNMGFEKPSQIISQ